MPSPPSSMARRAGPIFSSKMKRNAHWANFGFILRLSLGDLRAFPQGCKSFQDVLRDVGLPFFREPLRRHWFITGSKRAIGLRLVGTLNHRDQFRPYRLTYPTFMIPSPTSSLARRAGPIFSSKINRNAYWALLYSSESSIRNMVLSLPPLKRCVGSFPDPFIMIGLSLLVPFLLLLRFPLLLLLLLPFPLLLRFPLPRRCC